MLTCTATDKYARRRIYILTYIALIKMCITQSLATLHIIVPTAVYHNRPVYYTYIYRIPHLPLPGSHSPAPSNILFIFVRMVLLCFACHDDMNYTYLWICNRKQYFPTSHSTAECRFYVMMSMRTNGLVKAWLRSG